MAPPSRDGPRHAKRLPFGDLRQRAPLRGHKENFPAKRRKYSVYVYFIRLAYSKPDSGA